MKKSSCIALSAFTLLVGCAPTIYHKIHVSNTNFVPNDSLILSFNEICIDDSVDIYEVASAFEKMMAESVTKPSHKKSKITYKNAKISEDGKKLIKSFESCSLTTYTMKGERYPTIGWGHVIYPGDKTPNKISQKRADKIFDEDMKAYNALARESLAKLDHRFTYTQGFVDGLVSLIYNCGQAGVEKTRFWKAMQQCRYDEKTKNINIDDLQYAISFVKTANIVKRYKNGHTRRRKAEQAIMLAEL